MDTVEAQAKARQIIDGDVRLFTYRRDRYCASRIRVKVRDQVSWGIVYDVLKVATEDADGRA